MTVAWHGMRIGDIRDRWLTECPVCAPGSRPFPPTTAQISTGSEGRDRRAQGRAQFLRPRTHLRPELGTPAAGPVRRPAPAR
jgi:hypothetical protein